MAATHTLDTASAVLAAAREETGAAQRAEVRRFVLAVDWAAMHPVESIVHAATVDGSEGELTVAGEGAPLVAEFCVAELALALDMSTVAGRRFLGEAVETRYRLPRLWARVVAGEVPVWRARRVAQATLDLPIDGADHVDRHLAPVADTCSFAQLDRTIEAARARFDPEETETRRLEAAEHRHFDVRLSDVTLEGLVCVEGTLDLADALALEAAVAAKAHDLLDRHPHTSLDVRRSMAAGQLGGDASRELVIHTRHSPTDDLVGVDNTGSFVTVDQLADWCATNGTRVTIRPVLDLDEELTVDRYAPTPLQREQVVLTHATCVFPRCSRTSRSCDIDHITAYAVGGLTTSSNLAPLCRTHHRLKTRGGWTYRRIGRRSFIWTSPHGRRYRRDS